MDETRSVESVTIFTLEESMNTFIMQFSNDFGKILKDFDNLYLPGVQVKSLLKVYLIIFIPKITFSKMRYHSIANEMA